MLLMSLDPRVSHAETTAGCIYAIHAIEAVNAITGLNARQPHGYPYYATSLRLDLRIFFDVKMVIRLQGMYLVGRELGAAVVGLSAWLLDRRYWTEVFWLWRAVREALDERECLGYFPALVGDSLLRSEGRVRASVYRDDCHLTYSSSFSAEAPSFKVT